MKLFYRKYGNSGNQPIIILHGLFGISDNWSTYARRIALEGFEVFAVDQRNHGQSPQSDKFNYLALTDDISDFIDEHELDEVILLGHSLGGKVAMRFALENPHLIRKLIVVDISLKSYGPRDNHRQIIEAMKSVDLTSKSNRREVDDEMASLIPDIRIRQFIMKNLHRKKNNEFEWRIYLKGLENNIDQMFDAIETTEKYEKPTLFIRGGASDYILLDDFPQIRFNFPNAEISIYEPFYKNIVNEIKLGSNISKFNTNKDIKGNVDILFSVGGDGTMLDTVSIIRNSGIPIFGINLGRLGFLSSVSKHEISEAVECIFSGDYDIDKRALLQLKKPKNLFGNVNYALNDLTIYRNNATALVTVHVYVDDLFLNSYWGDGLIVSTPTGSTAYSLSVGGPIVTPGSKNFIISPIASHNLTVRPIILQDSSTIRIKIDGREEKHLLTLDSKISAISREDEIIIKRCNFTVNLIQMKNKNFYSTIRDKLYWGKDNRN